jgi:hypothetical protein
MRRRTTGTLVYFDYMRVADTIDSQKSEDRDITDKLPQMLLATAKVPRMQSQIFFFHTGKIMRLIELFLNSWPKSLSAAYTRANMVVNWPYYYYYYLYLYLQPHYYTSIFLVVSLMF